VISQFFLKIYPKYFLVMGRITPPLLDVFNPFDNIVPRRGESAAGRTRMGKEGEFVILQNLINSLL
jgi:hypothetical protein